MNKPKTLTSFEYMKYKVEITEVITENGDIAPYGRILITAPNGRWWEKYAGYDGKLSIVEIAQFCARHLKKYGFIPMKNKKTEKTEA